MRLSFVLANTNISFNKSGWKCGVHLEMSLGKYTAYGAYTDANKQHIHNLFILWFSRRTSQPHSSSDYSLHFVRSNTWSLSGWACPGMIQASADHELASVLILSWNCISSGMDLYSFPDLSVIWIAFFLFLFSFFKEPVTAVPSTRAVLYSVCDRRPFSRSPCWCLYSLVSPTPSWNKHKTNT